MTTGRDEDMAMDRTSSNLPSATTATPTRRRTVLRGAAAVGGVALTGGMLSACGSDAGSDAPSDSSNAPTSEPGSDTGSGPSDGGSGSELGPAADVEVGSGTIYADQKVVVTQPTEGEFKGFSAICTHQGCAVNQITADGIVCPCHGSTFSLEDGSPTAGPATEPLAKESVTDSGGRLVLG